MVLILSSAVYFGQGDSSRSEMPFFDNPLKPSYLYYLTYAVTGLVLFFSPQRTSRTSGGLILSMGILGLLHFFWMPFVPDQALEQRTLVLRMNVVVLAICFQIILSAVEDFGAILPAVRLVVWGTAILNMLVVLSPQSFTVSMGHFSGRAAGLFGDPNQCATMLAMILPLAVHDKSFLGRVLYYTVVFVGIFFTFSRSGMLGWALIVLCDLVLRPGVSGVKARSILANIALAAGIGGLVAVLLIMTWSDLFAFLFPNLNADTIARLKGADLGSGNERLYVLQIGYEVFKEHPFLGSGYAVTRDWGAAVSVHNMFILLVAEFGLVGGIWYLDFLRRILRFPGRFGWTLGSFLTFESIFTHSYLEFPFYLLAILLIWRLATLREEVLP